MTNELEKTLEDIVDEYSIAEVLGALSNICHEKADHIETNWQDAKLAKLWMNAGSELAKVSVKNTITRIS